MEKLEMTEGGRWSFGGRVLEPGDAVQLQLEGAWISGHIEEDPDRGDYFVAGNGEAYMVGLEGTWARNPQALSPEADFELALSEVLVSAGQAVAWMTMAAQQAGPEGRRALRTALRVKDAIYRIRVLRGQAVPAS